MYGAVPDAPKDAADGAAKGGMCERRWLALGVE